MSEISMEEAAAYVAERDLARALTTEQTLRLRVAELEGRLQLSEAKAGRFYAQITTEADRFAAAEKRARTYERLAEINGNTAERFERERDEACEAILRVEEFCEQMEKDRFWLQYGGSKLAARIRAKLKPRV